MMKVADGRGRRQTALESLRILDSDPEPFFDALTRAARNMTGMPIALISLVDGIANGSRPK